MANNIEASLDKIMDIEGAMAASIVDSSNGFMLACRGESLDLEYASAGNTELYHAKQKIMDNLNIHEQIEDFLITLETQYHVLMPVKQIEGVFIYFVCSKSRGTLALSRRLLKDIAAGLSLN